MSRDRLLTALSAITAILGIASTLMVFSQDRIFDADSFATTTASALEDPAVNAYLAERTSDALILKAPDLAIGGPVLTNVIGSVLESTPAVRVVERSAAAAHHTLFGDSGDSLVLDLADLIVIIEGALGAVDPELAAALPDEVATLAVKISSEDLTLETARLAERMRRLTAVLVLATVVLLVGLVVLESNTMTGLSRIGMTLGSIGLSLVVARNLGSGVLGSRGTNELEREALRAAWTLVVGDLARWGWMLVAAGALLAGLGWAAVQTGRVEHAARDLVRRVARRRESAWHRAAQVIALLGAATWALVSPLSFLGAIVRVGGFLAAVFVLARLAEDLGVADRLAKAAPEPAQVLSPRALAGRFVVPLLLIGGLGAAGLVLLSSDDQASSLTSPDACNGHVELCDRRLDEVTLATSHNSMSSLASGFLLPNHLGSIRAQLDHGVRGFMIDTVYGRPTGSGSVRTSTDLLDNDTLSPEALAAAERIRADHGADLGEESVYLCHAVCEIGALEASATLGSMRAWLEEHPREVLVFVVQDATSPTDTAAAFIDAGFGELVISHDLDDPFPTLGEMIETGRRVLVMVEEDGEGVDWLHDAFEFSQETPFSFAAAAEFSCVSNRGRSDSPLFVVNHFITLARAGNQTINDHDELMERASTCMRERGMQPSLLAVDFATRGDVIGVVDALNGVD